MVELVALRCPVCGAPFAPNDDRCGYCGSILTIKLDHPKIDPHSLNRTVINEHISKYRARVRNNPFDETAHYGLGVAYFNLGLIDEAIDELSQAARLMPENHNIQAQLAVMLKAAADKGDHQAASQLKQRVNSILELDPENLEALLIKSELLVEAGRYSEARRTLRDLRHRDPNRVLMLAEQLLVKRIGELLSDSNWDEASILIDELAMTNEQLAGRILRSYLSKSRREMPMTITENRKRSERIADKTTQVFMAAAGFVIGLILLVVMTSFGSRIVAVEFALLIGVLIWLACPFIALGYTRKMHKEKYISRGVTIDEKSAFSGPADVPYLLKAADAITRKQRGEMEVIH